MYYETNVSYTRDISFLHLCIEETISAEFIPMINAVLKIPRGRHLLTWSSSACDKEIWLYGGSYYVT